MDDIETNTPLKGHEREKVMQEIQSLTINGFNAGLTSREYALARTEAQELALVDRYPSAFFTVTDNNPRVLQSHMRAFIYTASDYAEAEHSRIVGKSPDFETSLKKADKMVDHETAHIHAAQELGLTVNRYQVAMRRDENQIPNFEVRVRHLEKPTPFQKLYVSLAPDELSDRDYQQAKACLKVMWNNPDVRRDSWQELKNNPEIGKKLRPKLNMLLVQILREELARRIQGT